MQTKATINRLRVLAGILLIISMALPLYIMPTSWSGDTETTFAWDLVREDLAGAGFLVFAFAGPVLVAMIRRQRLARKWSILLNLSEPFLLATSAFVLLAVASSAFTLLPLFGPWLLIPVSGTMGIGVWSALTACSMLLLLWAISMGRHVQAARRGRTT